MQIASRQRVGLGFYRKVAPDEPEILDPLLILFLRQLHIFFILIFVSSFYHLQYCIMSLLISTFIEAPNIRFLSQTQLPFNIFCLNFSWHIHTVGFGRWHHWPGELHIILWELAALSKYVEDSGIGQAWVEAELYSPTTVTQCKNMYRALKAPTVTFIALYS